MEHVSCIHTHQNDVTLPVTLFRTIFTRLIVGTRVTLARDHDQSRFDKRVLDASNPKKCRKGINVQCVAQYVTYYASVPSVPHLIDVIRCPTEAPCRIEHRTMRAPPSSLHAAAQGNTCDVYCLAATTQLPLYPYVKLFMSILYEHASRH